RHLLATKTTSLTASSNHNVMQLLSTSHLGRGDGFSLALKHIGLGIREIGLRGRWEIILLDWSLAGGRRRDLLASSSNQILSLSCGGSSVLLHGLKPLACVLSSEV